ASNLGTLYALNESTTRSNTGTASNFITPSLSFYGARKEATTYATDIAEDGGTTYIIYQNITRVDIFDSHGTPVSTYTEPQAVFQTIVAGASYQRGTYPAIQTNSATQTQISEVTYTCSYDLEHGTGRCVQACMFDITLSHLTHSLCTQDIYGTTTTQLITQEGRITPVATFSPFKPQNSDHQRSSFDMSPGAFAGMVVGACLGFIIFVIISVLCVLRCRDRRRAR
ncbi:hypothetical protein DL96DRAFT_1606673, partial [Flagelloscypha sp. PMI_526]